MEIIMAYLDTMFSPYPQTPRLLEAKAELRAMMEDAYTAAIAAGRSQNEAVGQVITEFGNLDELAPLLGIATEIRPRAASPASISPDDGVGYSPTADTSHGPGGPRHHAYDSQNLRGGDPLGPEPARRVTGSGGLYGGEFAASPSAGGGTGTYYADQAATRRRPPEPPSYPPIAMDEARAFAEAYQRGSRILSLAVALFVLSPMTLIGLTVLSANPGFPMDSGIASLIGLVVLLVVVFLGVALVLQRGRVLQPFERILEGHVAPTPEVTAWARSLRSEQEGRASAALIVAVALWILSALPVIASGLLTDYAGAWGGELPGLGVPLTLIMVAAGLLIYLPTTWAASVSEYVSLEDGPHAGRDDDAHPAPIRALLALLWPATLATYLLWSFVGSAWHISWIVFPIAGIAHWALAELGDSLARRDH